MSTMNDELPVYTVEGANWLCQVYLDEDDTSFDKQEQVMEAATKAIEIFKGVQDPLTSDQFQITDGDTSPYLGISVLVYPKNSDADKEGVFVYSYVALANGGFYQDSIASLKLLAKEAEKIKHAHDLKNFDKLKQKASLKKKKGKSPPQSKNKKKDSS